MVPLSPVPSPIPLLHCAEVGMDPPGDVLYTALSSELLGPWCINSSVIHVSTKELFELHAGTSAVYCNGSLVVKWCHYTRFSILPVMDIGQLWFVLNPSGQCGVFSPSH